jgi:PBP1b-binding outer membrane lipoprotein LpoB
MKNLKTIIILLLFTFITTSCDDKIDSLENLNKAPTLEYFSRNTTNWTEINGVIVDSAKVHNDINNSNYSIALRSKDLNNNFETIKISNAVNGGVFYIDDVVSENEIMVELDSFSLAYRYFNKDVRLFTVKSIDDFGKFQQVDFEIHFLDNLLPIPSFEIRNENVNGIVEHIIDASFSKDADFSRGGYINNYEFYIDGIIINSNISEIRHVFQNGAHQIGLRVQDNDGMFSEQIIKDLFIN